MTIHQRSLPTKAGKGFDAGSCWYYLKSEPQQRL